MLAQNFGSSHDTLRSRSSTLSSLSLRLHSTLWATNFNSQNAWCSHQRILEAFGSLRLSFCSATIVILFRFIAFQYSSSAQVSSHFDSNLKPVDYFQTLLKLILTLLLAAISHLRVDLEKLILQEFLRFLLEGHWFALVVHHSKLESVCDYLKFQSSHSFSLCFVGIFYHCLVSAFGCPTSTFEFLFRRIWAFLRAELLLFQPIQ